MQALILAGGEGSRLAASGITVPKAMVPVRGEPQLVRLIRQCRLAGYDQITCAVRTDLEPELSSTVSMNGARLLAVRTESSLHTLAAGLASLPDVPVFCVLVDTVVPDIDWVAAHTTARARLVAADAVVAVTSYVNDEKPLWVDAGPSGRVTAFGRRGASDSVTGGMYWLAPSARRSAHRAVADGVQRLRGFLARLVEQDGRVMTVTIPKIIDIDTATDLEEAIALLEASHG